MSHPLMEKIKTLFETDRDSATLKDCSQMLFDLAVVAEGGKLDNPARFSKLVGEAMATAMDQ